MRLHAAGGTVDLRGGRRARPPARRRRRPPALARARRVPARARLAAQRRAARAARPPLPRELRDLAGAGWHTLRRALPAGADHGRPLRRPACRGAAAAVSDAARPERLPVRRVGHGRAARALRPAPTARRARADARAGLRAHRAAGSTASPRARSRARAGPVASTGPARGCRAPIARLRSERHDVRAGARRDAPRPTLRWPPRPRSPGLDRRQVREPQPRCWREPPARTYDWVIVVDDDVELAPALPRPLRGRRASALGLDLAQPAQTLAQPRRLARSRGAGPAARAAHRASWRSGRSPPSRAAPRTELTPVPRAALRLGPGQPLGGAGARARLAAREWSTRCRCATSGGGCRPLHASPRRSAEARRFLAGRPYVRAAEAARTLAEHRGWRERRMRVAVVAEWYPSPADPVLGVWAHRQAVAARDAGAEVRVLALRRPVPPLATLRALPDLGPLRRWAGGVRSTLRPFELGGRWRSRRSRSSARHGRARTGPGGTGPRPPWAAALDRLRSRWDFDLVHAHSVVPPGYAALRGRGARPPLVVSTHGPDVIHVAEASGVARRASQAALRGAALVMANSRWAERRCEEIAGGPLPSAVVHLGTDLPPNEAQRHERPTIVTVAHLVARKRHAVVLHALAALRDGLELDYVVIGDGPGRQPLERLARELGLAERVRFLGQLEHERALAEARRCHVFVCPVSRSPSASPTSRRWPAGCPPSARAARADPRTSPARGGDAARPARRPRGPGANARRALRRRRRGPWRGRPPHRRGELHLGALRARDRGRIRAGAGMTDLLVVSLGTTRGLRVADEAFVALAEAGVEVEAVGVRIGALDRLRRAYPVNDLVEAAAARRTLSGALRRGPRAVVFSSVTAAMLAPRSTCPTPSGSTRPPSSTGPARATASCTRPSGARSTAPRSSCPGARPRSPHCRLGKSRPWCSRPPSSPRAHRPAAAPGPPWPTCRTPRRRDSTCWSAPGAKPVWTTRRCPSSASTRDRRGLPRAERSARAGQRRVARPRPGGEFRAACASAALHRGRPLGGLRPGAARSARRRRAARHRALGRRLRGARHGARARAAARRRRSRPGALAAAIRAAFEVDAEPRAATATRAAARAPLPPRRARRRRADLIAVLPAASLPPRRASTARSKASASASSGWRSVTPSLPAASARAARGRAPSAVARRRCRSGPGIDDQRVLAFDRQVAGRARDPEQTSGRPAAAPSRMVAPKGS